VSGVCPARGLLRRVFVSSLGLTDSFEPGSDRFMTPEQTVISEFVADHNNYCEDQNEERTEEQMKGVAEFVANPKELEDRGEGIDG
jgi:hypothetical protein